MPSFFNQNLGPKAPYRSGFYVGVCWIAVILATSPAPSHAAPAAVAVASGGAVVAIDTSGAVTTILASKYTTGPSCAFDASTETFFSIQRAASELPLLPLSSNSPPVASTARARLVGINVTSHSTIYDDEMPFDASNATAFAGGLDFYLALHPNSSGASVSGGGLAEGAELVAVGGDELQFVHVLSVKPSLSKATYDDLLQYGSGIRLNRGLSLVDPTRNELWLQVVYDISSSSSSSSKPPIYQAYWKRYSLSPPALINVLPDISNAAAAAFDPSTRSIFIIGTCDQNSTASGRCSYVLNPSDDFPRFILKEKLVWGSAQPSQSPALSRHHAPSVDDTTFFAMMGGLGKLSNDGKFLFIIGQETPSPPPQLPALICSPVSHDDSVCTRAGDASADDVLQSGWSLLSIDLGSGTVAQKQPLQWQSETKPDLLLCMA